MPFYFAFLTTMMFYVFIQEKVSKMKDFSPQIAVIFKG